MKSINIPRDINPQQIHIINRSTPVIDNNIPLSSVRIKRDKHLGSAQNLPPKKPMMRQLSRPPRRRRRPVGVAPLKLLPHVLRFMARDPAWLQQRVAFKIAVGGYPSKTGKHHRAGCSWLSDCRRHSFPPGTDTGRFGFDDRWCGFGWCWRITGNNIGSTSVGHPQR